MFWLGLLMAVPVFSYEFKTTGQLFAVQNPELLKQAADLRDPVLFIQTDIPNLIDDGPSSLKTIAVEGGYLVQLEVYPRQQEFLSVLVAPQFIPLEVSIPRVWSAGEVFGFQVERAGLPITREGIY